MQPWVQRLLQLGSASLQGVRMSANLVSCPEPLANLPLRHLELDIGHTSTARLREITSALGHCSTLEYLVISNQDAFEHIHAQVKLPKLCLHSATNLKHVHFQACFPGGPLCLPSGCQLRLDLVQRYQFCWDYKWQSEDANDLIDRVPVLCLKFVGNVGEQWPSHMHTFKALQYLQMERPPQLTDLAMLQHIPHVRLEVSQTSLLHTAGSWQSLEIKSYDGFEISFVDIDAFVRDNRNYLFQTYHTPKFWRSMKSALEDASSREGLRCHPSKFRGYERVSSIQEVANSRAHVACVEDFWPKQSMRSCLARAAPTPKANVSECKCRLSNAGRHDSTSYVTEDVSIAPVLPRPNPPILKPRAIFQPSVSIGCGSTSGPDAIPDLSRREPAGHLYVSPFVSLALPVAWPDPPFWESRPVRPSISTSYRPVMGLNALPDLNHAEHVNRRHVLAFVASPLPVIAKPNPPTLEPRPVIKPSVSTGSGPVRSLGAQLDLSNRKNAGWLSLRGCLVWLTHKLKQTRITLRCANCVVVEAPRETI